MAAMMQAVKTAHYSTTLALDIWVTCTMSHWINLLFDILIAFQVTKHWQEAATQQSRSSR